MVAFVFSWVGGPHAFASSLCLLSSVLLGLVWLTHQKHCIRQIQKWGSHQTTQTGLGTIKVLLEVWSSLVGIMVHLYCSGGLFHWSLKEEFNSFTLNSNYVVKPRFVPGSERENALNFYIMEFYFHPYKVLLHISKRKKVGKKCKALWLTMKRVPVTGKYSTYHLLSQKTMLLMIVIY